MRTCSAIGLQPCSRKRLTRPLASKAGLIVANSSLRSSGQRVSVRLAVTPLPEGSAQVAPVMSCVNSAPEFFTIAPQRLAVNALKVGEHELMSENVRLHLRDTHDHIVQLAEGVEQARELVNGLMNTYLTVVSNRMNEVMKTLTIVASIFIPLTFMAGIYGMNFEHMPELGAHWAYPLLLGSMAVVATGMVVYFWRKGWIGRHR